MSQSFPYPPRIPSFNRNERTQPSRAPPESQRLFSPTHGATSPVERFRFKVDGCVLPYPRARTNRVPLPQYEVVATTIEEVRGKIFDHYVGHVGGKVIWIESNGKTVPAVDDTIERNLENFGGFVIAVKNKNNTTNIMTR